VNSNQHIRTNRNWAEGAWEEGGMAHIGLKGIRLVLRKKRNVQRLIKLK
jgi:hypothetical protein